MNHVTQDLREVESMKEFNGVNLMKARVNNRIDYESKRYKELYRIGKVKQEILFVLDDLGINDLQRGFISERICEVLEKENLLKV